MEFTSDQRYQLAVDPDVLWSTIARVDDYRQWWPWLRGFDARGLVAGDRWKCVVQPPLPYAVNFTITLDDVAAPTAVSATLSGDIEGTARLEVSEHASGSEARLLSSLAPANRLLRAVALVAPPLVRFGHDWVLSTGLRQFLDRAVDRSA